MKTLLTLALAILFPFYNPLLRGQAVNATLLGTVVDSTGALIANAKVTITEVNTGASHSSQTNDSGNYTFPDLPPGQYTVTVENTGFKTEIRRNIIVLVNTNTRVDVQLQPGNISEHVEVTAEAPRLETDRADTGVKIETQLVEDQPLPVNRNFQSLLALVPGSSGVTFQHSQFFNAASSLQTEINGQMRMGNNFMIEGTDDNERTGLLQILVPPVEAIQTVDVVTSNFDPELGRASGAVTNVILKSGTNTLHGAAYEFLQNSALDARSFFSPSVGHIAYNYVGGNVGGAIIKNKLFFFGDYLRVMDHEANTNLVTIPSMPFRTGDLSAATTMIYDPATGDRFTGVGRTPFPNNQIPLSRINPVSAAILGLLPAPNQAFNPANPSNNYFALLPFQKTTDSLDYKTDYNINDKDRLSGRFSFARPVVFQAPLFGNAVGGDGPGGAFMGTGEQKTYSGGLNYDHIFTPTFLMDARINVAHYHNVANPSDYGSNDATKLGIPGVNISPLTSGQVGVNIQNTFSQPLIGYSPSLPWIRAEANVDVVNNWTKIVRNHTFKFGVDLKRIRDDLLQGQTFSPRGVYNFNVNQTALPPSGNTPASTTGVGNAMASFLLDSPSQAGRDLFTYFPAYRQWEFFAYAGDTWQVTQKLTLDLGLRWEFYPPATPAFAGGFSNYNPTNNTLVIAGVGGNPTNLGMQTQYHYFAPRLGVAYRVTEGTVIRAGYGVSYTPFPDNNYAYNFPVRANNAYNTIGNGYGPAVLADGVTPATFQAGFPAPVPVKVPSNGIIPVTGTPLNAQSFFYIPQNWKNPYVESWNLAVQQALPWHFVLDVAYVANHGVDTVSQPNINSALVIGTGTAGEPGAKFGRTASTTQLFDPFSSSYNSMQVKLDRRFQSGLLITTAFTWQKAMSFQTGDDGGLIFFIDQRRNYAPTDFDRTLNFVQTYSYALPFGASKRWLSSGVPSRIFGGWTVSGFLTVLSGLPFFVTANGGSLNSPGSTQTANQVAPVTYPHGINIGHPWFSTASFAQPTGVAFGSVGRNDMFGPGLFGLNMSLNKQIRITERLNMQIRADAFQITNTPQFSNPCGGGGCQESITSANFGYVTSTVGSGSGVNGIGGGRAFQMGVKFDF
ncbi:MAG TPA: TonB-dependent receptor [Bryobacteraceae bacterium]|nr:TonB-dependent receptor [Bryobacteraceae bacterium]